MEYFKLLLAVILSAALIGYFQQCITKKQKEQQFVSIDPSTEMSESSKPMVFNNDDHQWLVSQSPSSSLEDSLNKRHHGIRKAIYSRAVSSK